MRRRRTIILSLFTFLTLLVQPGIVKAIPPLPSSFYGTVKLNNSNLPDGTGILALINDQVVASGLTMTYQGDSVYSLDVPGDDSTTTKIEGGKEGDIIHFKVGGLDAKETGMWHSGTNIELPISITSTSTTEPPQPTRTPLPTQTAIIVIRVSPTVFPSETLTLPSPQDTPVVKTTEAIQPGVVTEEAPTVVESTEAQTNTVETEIKSIQQKWIFIPISIISVLVLAFCVWLVIKKSKKTDQ